MNADQQKPLVSTASDVTKKESNGGCFNSILNLFIWIIIIAFVINSFKSCNTDNKSPASSGQNTVANSDIHSNSTGSTTEGTETSIPNDQTGSMEIKWRSVPVISSSNATLYANLPDHLIENLREEDSGSFTEYSTENWGISLTVLMHNGEDEPLDYDWTQEKADSSYDGTSGDFLFEVTSEGLYNDYIRDAFLQLEIEPSMQSSKKTINGMEWYVTTYTGSDLEGSGIDLSITVYFHADNYSLVSVVLTSAYSISDITMDERMLMNEWLSSIPASLVIQNS